MIVALSKAGDFRLADHVASTARLHAVMRRVGVSLDPAEFINVVVSAFREVSVCRDNLTGVELGVVQREYRLDGSFRLFQEALRVASEKGERSPSILVLGCGSGFAGKTADFATTIVAEAFGEASQGRTVKLNLTPGVLYGHSETSGSEQHFLQHKHAYDLVVSHSLLHFVPDLAAFFKLTRWFLKPAGGIIISHEPNSRFWANAECQAAVAELRKDLGQRRWSGILNPSRLLARFRGGAKLGAASFWEEVNQVLQQRYGFTAPLSEAEIRRLTDVHRPEVVTGDFRIGLNGFDHDELAHAYLPGFRLVWVGTSNYLGYNALRLLAPRWRSRAVTLAARYPLDGSVFTGYWSQDATS